MYRGRKSNAELRAHILAHWKHESDRELADSFGLEASATRIRFIRQSMGLVRDKAMLDKMFQSHKERRHDYGRGPDRVLQRKVSELRKWQAQQRGA